MWTFINQFEPIIKRQMQRKRKPCSTQTPIAINCLELGWCGLTLDGSRRSVSLPFNVFEGPQNPLATAHRSHRFEIIFPTMQKKAKIATQGAQSESLGKIAKNRQT